MKNISSIERIADQALNHFRDHSLPAGFCQSFFKKRQPIFSSGRSSPRNFSTGSALESCLPVIYHWTDENIL